MCHTNSSNPLKKLVPLQYVHFYTIRQGEEVTFSNFLTANKVAQKLQQIF